MGTLTRSARISLRNPQSLSVEGTNLAIFVEVDDFEGAMRRLSA
jgi:hypothetical protein